MRLSAPRSRFVVCLSMGLALALAVALEATLEVALDARQAQGAGQGQAQQAQPAQPQTPGQGRGQGAGGGAPAAPDAVPSSAASIVANPAMFVGRTVTITASVARTLTPTAFTVGQNRSTTQGEVLIIASMLTAAPAANDYVTVIGDAVAFDAADATRRLRGAALNLPADVIAAFTGKPAIIATAILTSDLTDLTKRKPDPMTPDDVKLSAIMKLVNPAATALRTAATGGDATAAKARVDELKKLFTDAQTVFKAGMITTAVNWSADALKALDAADAATAAAKWPDVTAAAATLTQTCTACHAAHRVRQDDGTFRLKK